MEGEQADDSTEYFENDVKPEIENAEKQKSTLPREYKCNATKHKHNLKTFRKSSMKASSKNVTYMW